MGFCKILCKLILFVINIIFLILGFAFLIPGAMFKAESPVIKDRIQPFLDSLNDVIKETGYASSNESIDFAAIFSGIATGMIVFGILLIVLTLAVMIGCCCVNTFLIFYAIFVLILVIIQAAFLGMFFNGNFDDKIKSEYETTIREKYRGTDKFDVDSVLVNFFHLNYECCGIDNYRDFANAEKWEKKRERTVNVQGFSGNVTIFLTTPISCCKMKGSFPSADPEDPEICAVEEQKIKAKGKQVTDVSNRDVGCWKKIKEDRNSKKGLIVGACCGLIGFQLLLIVLAIIAYVTTRNEQNSKVNYA